MHITTRRALRVTTYLSHWMRRAFQRQRKKMARYAGRMYPPQPAYIPPRPVYYASPTGPASPALPSSMVPASPMVPAPPASPMVPAPAASSSINDARAPSSSNRCALLGAGRIRPGESRSHQIREPAYVPAPPTSPAYVLAPAPPAYVPAPPTSPAYMPAQPPYVPVPPPGYMPPEWPSRF